MKQVRQMIQLNEDYALSADSMNILLHQRKVNQREGTKGYGDGLIVGWITALQYMKEGDRVELYIPSALGYGTQSQSSIPANSVLIFDLKLEKVIHPDGLESYSLKVD
jgi:hypothetical protein